MYLYVFVVGPNKQDYSRRTRLREILTAEMSG